MMSEGTARNTDRELWREREGDYYADSIHVTEGGGIGINCGGTVIVKPVREWHLLAMQKEKAFFDSVEYPPDHPAMTAPSQQAPEVGGSVNIISSSYGNDSVALIQWAHEQGLTGVTVAYCITGWASPGWYTNRVTRGEDQAHSYGFKHHRCESIGMAELVRQRNGWPGNGMQFCTSELKIFPFLKWLDDEVDQEHKAVILIGKRRAESERRKDTPEFIESSEMHGGRKVWHPLYCHTDFERNALLHRAGWEPLPHRSLECSPCVNANRNDFLRLSPGEIERVNGLEAEIGKPMFRPKRFNTVGIHGVIQWAKNGRDRGMFEEEEAECASLFGCGV